MGCSLALPTQRHPSHSLTSSTLDGTRGGEAQEKRYHEQAERHTAVGGACPIVPLQLTIRYIEAWEGARGGNRCSATPSTGLMDDALTGSSREVGTTVHDNFLSAPRQSTDSKRIGPRWLRAMKLGRASTWSIVLTYVPGHQRLLVRLSLSHSAALTSFGTLMPM